MTCPEPLLIPALVALGASAFGSVSGPATTRPEPQAFEWRIRHEAKVREAQQKKDSIKVVLIGDSITRGLEGVPDLVESAFPGKTVLNLGFTADRTEHILWRLRNGELDGLSPELVVIMAGTNNTGQRRDPPEVTAKAVGMIVQEVLGRCPQAKILLLSIFPCGEKADDPRRQLNDKANALLPGLADGTHVFHLNINAGFLNPQGNLSADLMPDLLHPNRRGYEIWMEAMRSEAAKLSGADGLPVPSQLAVNLTAGKKQTIVTYGTSLTAVGAWVDQLNTVLSQVYPGQATVINAAQGGASSVWGRENLEAKVIAHHPDTVILEFAINDALAQLNIPVEQSRQNLNAMIDRIYTVNPACQVILAVMNPPVGHGLCARPQLSRYEQMYRDTARARGLLLVDHGTPWRELLARDPSAFLRYVPDGIHPVREGCLRVTTPNLLRELGLPPGKPEASTSNPGRHYYLHLMRVKSGGAAVSRVAWEARLGELFVLADVDKDGSLTASEFPPQNAFEVLDADGDGKMTMAEFVMFFDKDFRKFDQNGDGSIAPEEENSHIETI